MAHTLKKALWGAGLFAVFVFASLLYGVLVLQHKHAKVRIGNAMFEVEIAETLMQKAKGLAGRGGLAENKGMLFIFDVTSKPSFWMAGMKFPIDIVWVSGNRVIGIEKNVPVGDLKLYTPPASIDRVVEVVAGVTDMHGIKIGDRYEEI